MRKKELHDGFCLAGKIKGAVKPDVVREISLPFMLQSAENVCGQEGLFLRSWDLYTSLERPEEPAHSHAERTLLTLDGVYGKGMVYIGSTICEPIAPHMVLDVTEALRCGSAQMRLHFPPQHPVLLSGERGRDLIAEGGLISAELRNIYHMSFTSMCIDLKGRVKIDIHAYASGKIRLCLRLIKGEELLWTENSSVQLVVGDQRIERMIGAEFLCSGAVLHAAADMGGEGCDSCEAVYSTAVQTPKYTAHFRALPTVQILRYIHDAGFDGVVFYDYPHMMLQKECRTLGLHIQWKREEIILHPLLQNRKEPETSGNGCLAVAMTNADERQCFKQACYLSEAVFAHRADRRECRVLALSRQRDAQDGLFDAKGEPRAALFALRNALSKVTVWATGINNIYHPYEEFDEEIMLFAASPDNKPAAIQAQLYSWNGKEIACRMFPVCVKEAVQSLGSLRARLPWNGLKGLVLRLQCIREGRILAVNHVYYSCANEDGDSIPFPQADLTECDPGELCNVSDAVAMGVSIFCGNKVVLSHSAMLPQERIMLANDPAIMVKYGNPVMKGGKKCVEQRILRGVFKD